MLRLKLRVVFVVIALVTMLPACTPATSLSISMEEFGITSLPLPEGWEKRRDSANERREQELGACESRGQDWASTKPGRGGFGFDVYRFESVTLAKKGYETALRLLRKPGFTLTPPPEYQYTSDFADQYTIFCGSLETTPGTCTAVARYANYVVTVGLAPGDGVTWEQIPALFGAVDHHIRMVMENASHK
ncbi:MAG: hypothetical protein H5T62_15930 [Anaerolineae bacterium]|nr:hypothetical protein [Anaerolineae bacterium]